MSEISGAEVVRTLHGHSSDVTSVSIRNNVIATCSSDKTVRIWEYTNAPEDIWELPFSPLLGHKYTVHCCCFSNTENLLITCSTDGNIFFWNTQNGELDATLKHPSNLGIRVCSISPNGVLLATGGEDDTVVIWDVSTRTILRSLEGHEATITSCAFSPDSAFIISGSSNCEIALWDARYSNGNWLCRTIEAHDLGVLCVNFSPTYLLNNGDKETPETTYLLASCGNDNSVLLWHVKTGATSTITQYQELRGHSANVWSCQFSPDGKFLASTGGDKAVIIWDPLQGAIVQKLERHSRYVTCCAFTSDGQYLATGSNDKTLILWKLFRDGKFAEAHCVPSSPSYEVNVPKVSRQFSIPNKDPQMPEEFYCPITQEVMKDPVIAADGFTYERSAISSWFQSGKDTSPMTNERLRHMQLITNIILKVLIKKHIESSQ